VTIKSGVPAIAELLNALLTRNSSSSKYMGGH
jgi:hypothetical protein